MAGSETADRRVQLAPLTAPADLTFHWVVLWISAAVLLAACLLQVRSGEQVVVPLLELPLPGVCTYKRWFGAECPGCGLTRCFISLAHGDVAGAWRFNPAGIFLFAVVLAQLPYRGVQIWRARRGLAEIRWRRLTNLVLWLLVAALFLQWILRTVVPALVWGEWQLW